MGDDGDGTMESIYWGNGAGWSHGYGAGPWGKYANTPHTPTRPPATNL